MTATEVVALIAATSTLLAGLGTTWLTLRGAHRRDVRLRRLAAYEQLAVATQVLAARSELLHHQRNLPAIAVDTAQTHLPGLLAMALLAWPRATRELGAAGAAAVANRIPAAVAEPAGTTAPQVVAAFEDVIAAAAAVRLHGSSASVAAAEELLAAASAFTEVAGAAPLRWRRQGQVLDRRRRRLIASRKYFLDTVRPEAS